MASVLRPVLCALAAAALAWPAHAAPNGKDEFRFAAIGHTLGDEALLKQALADSSESSLAFVAVTGIKGANEDCSDKLFKRRLNLLDDAARPLIVSLAASDWTECRNSAGRSSAVERLNRLRELFFAEPHSLGARKLALTRLSGTAKFRSYAENAHWQVGKVLFATLNVPSNNNHYLRAAGRNSEFEDRLVANRAWLHRLFTLARRERLEALVLFTEADISPAAPARPKADDGFAELRRQLASIEHKYPGKILLVDAAPLAADARPSLTWHGNVGHVSLGSHAAEIKVDPDQPSLFVLTEPDQPR